MCIGSFDHWEMLCPFTMRKRDGHHIQFDSESCKEPLVVSAVSSLDFELLNLPLSCGFPQGAAGKFARTAWDVMAHRQGHPVRI